MPAFTAQPFVRGQIYNRRRDIHAHFKGNPYGGIAATKDFPFIFLFTGEAGETYGYSDIWRDGVFLYSGEGQIGHQQMTKGNKAILEHAKTGKELLLFRKIATGKVQFEGCFHCAGWENQRGKDRNGNSRNLIVFHLKPEDGVAEAPAEFVPDPTDRSRIKRIVTLEVLRSRAYDAAQPAKHKSTAAESARFYYERNGAIREYVLKRANGVCECCGFEAPFVSKSGEPYLEAHHIHRLSDRGLDDPKHVAGICPTCHRKIHHGQNGPQLDDDLAKRIQAKEASLQTHGINRMIHD